MFVDIRRVQPAVFVDGDNGCSATMSAAKIAGVSTFGLYFNSNDGMKMRSHRFSGIK